MEKEFNLSEKRKKCIKEAWNWWVNLPQYNQQLKRIETGEEKMSDALQVIIPNKIIELIEKQDKEFIKLLKEETFKPNTQSKGYIDIFELINKIDKLTGPELI